ncbi:hypothetical protein DPMN_157015 [Dreissena polymorpha]|uniref:RIOX1/NO66-like C-terminal winged helix domain-containing protein n=1 Tax=Dreissena polymorpha TaxID=45954 RepID=A0A9D4FS75_DREPO|nr:hypothetical protein DPMN_157015 [Dreissena polymorpha]
MFVILLRLNLGRGFDTNSVNSFPGEKSCSIHGHGERWDPASNAVRDHTEMEPDTMVKLIRKGCLRLITEEDTVRVYYNIENAFSAAQLPEYVAVDSLSSETVEERLEIATILYDRGLLVNREPLQNVHVDDTSSDEGLEEGALDEGFGLQ